MCGMYTQSKVEEKVMKIENVQLLKTLCSMTKDERKSLKIECANDIIQEMREKSLINIKKELPKNNEKIVEKFIETN